MECARERKAFPLRIFTNDNAKPLLMMTKIPKGGSIMKSFFVTIGNRSFIQSAKSLEALANRLPDGASAVQTITVSEMTGKLTGIPAINTSPLDNPFCERMAKTDSICAKCYSRKMVSCTRKNCRDGWRNNGEILSTHLLSDAEIMALRLDAKAPYGIVRFSAHGELINQVHCRNLIAIAMAYPELTFALWTKRLDVVHECLQEISKPENLVIIYSNPAVDAVIPVTETQRRCPFADKVFNVVTKDSDSVNCGARSCATCKLCYNKDTTSEIIEKLK